jgi:phage gp36-like protein
MSYCIQGDIEKLIPVVELAELTAESGIVPDLAVLAGAIAKADAEIDSYLGMNYAVPLSTTPARVKALSEDISIYYLYMRRSAIPEPRQKAYDDAIAFLKLLAAGTVKLPSATSPETQGVQFNSAASIFDRDNMSGY